MTLSWGRRLAASLFSALAVAIVAHLAIVFVYFVAQGFQTAALVAASDYFALASVVAFVLVFVAVIFGAFRSRPVALATGIVAGALGAIIGSLIVVVAAGASLSPELFSQLFGTLVAVALPFWLAMGITAMSLGVVVYRAVLDYRTPANELPLAFVRIPSTAFAADAADATAVDEQWDAFVTALSEAGYRTREVPERHDAPFGVCVADAAVLLGDVAVLSPVTPSSDADADTHDPAQPAAVNDVEETLRAEGIAVERFTADARISALDTLRVGNTIFAATSAHTTPEGIRRAREIAGEAGLTVVGVPPLATGASLRDSFTALADGTVLGYGEHRVHAALFGRYLALSEPAGVQSVALDGDTVIVPASAPLTAALIESFGYRVVIVDLGSFESRGRGARSLALVA